MSSAHTTDWTALGLAPERGVNAFTQVPPKRYQSPPKNLSKDELAAMRNRQNALNRYHRLKALQNNMANPFCTPIATTEQSQRTQAIAGRRIA